VERKQADIHADRHTRRQTFIHADIHTDIQTHNLMHTYVRTKGHTCLRTQVEFYILQMKLFPVIKKQNFNQKVKISIHFLILLTNNPKIPKTNCKLFTISRISPADSTTTAISNKIQLSFLSDRL
jgi:hypothetical protein